MRTKAIAAAVGVVATGIAGLTAAGPDKIKYPADYLKGTLYGTVDRPDIKQYRELYASPGVVEAVRADKPLKFLNTDDSPHWIAVQGAPQKTEVLLRGQTGSITFDKAGAYNYICGLHPSMKGVIEVK